jgi:hypothetical protein
MDQYWRGPKGINAINNTNLISLAIFLNLTSNIRCAQFNP